MYRRVADAFMSSDDATEQNRSNILRLINRVSDNKIREDIKKKIKSKKMNQQETTLTHYLSNKDDKNRFKTGWM